MELQRLSAPHVNSYQAVHMEDVVVDGQAGAKQKKVRVPRRVIHCSDGVIEEYSTDEEELEARKVEAEREAARKAAIAAINPKQLAWVPWMVHYTWFAGSTLLTYCDFVGEKLAWFLGITSPKYYYELEEFKRMKLEEEERQKQQDAESAGWKASPDSSQTIDMGPTKQVDSEPATIEK